MPATYEPIATTTLSSAAANITFSSITSAYTDLRLVLTTTTSVSGQNIFMKFNSDSGTNYSYTDISGNGATVYANYISNYTSMILVWNGTSATNPTFYTQDILSYSGSTFKPVLSTTSEDDNGSGATRSAVQLWRSTSAINNIALTLGSGNFNTGTTATLYGILKA